MNQKQLKDTLFVIIRILLIISLIIQIYLNSWFLVFLTALTLIILLSLPVIFKKYDVTLPLFLELLIIFFIIGTLILGEAGNFYERFWWWDVLLHTLSGFILGIVGFILVFTVTKYNPKKATLSPGFIALFSFSFALSIGALWEIFEFLMDSFFNLNMQKSGLNDTMSDLMVDMTGALIVSITSYFFLNERKTILESWYKHILKIKK